MTWTSQVPAGVGALVVVAAVFILPGAGLLALARVRGLLAWALGPSLTALLLGVSGVVLPLLGIPWGPVGIALVALPAVAVAAALGWWRRHDDPLRSEPTPPDVRRLIWAAAALAGTVLVVGTCLGMPDAAAPLQVRDSIVHLNALELVRAEGDASMFGGLDVVVSSAGAGSFYPSVWHAALALVPVGSVGLVSNAGMLAVAVVLWPLSMIALARAVFPAQPAAAVVVAVFSCGFSFFPFGQLVLSAQWPNGLGTSMIPALLAATILWVRSWHDPRVHGRERARLVVSGGLVVAAGVAGSGLAHPNTVFSYLVFAGPFLLAVAWRVWRTAPRTRADVVRVVAVAVAAAGLGWALLVLSGLGAVLSSVMGYDQILPERPYLFTLVRVLADTSLSSLPGSVVLTAVVLTGVVVLVRERRLRWIVLAWAGTLVLAALAGGPENPLRGITGFWYKHVFRLEALYPVSALLLAAVGVLWWAGYLHRRWGTRRPWTTVAGSGAAVVAAAVVLSGGLQVAATAERSAGVYDPAQLGRRLIVSDDDRALLARLPDLVPPGAVVIGDPNAGAVLVYSFGGRVPVYYRQGADHLGVDQAFLAGHLDQIRDDPEVCAALGRLGADHLYLNTSTEDQTWPSNLATRALRDVDTASGFELLAREGDAYLYRITACG